ncbi:MAG TPA: zinc ribbon domain-containing protein [Actinomycetota bacterium]|nr:zinc ribbon domain-containing protein [Actinomycetota bacterium]
MDDSLAWRCPSCETPNPIEAEVCDRCGTPFRALFEEDERPAARVDPGTAFARSLLFPGLGHRAAGRGAEGLARGVVFAWLIGTVAAILIVRGDAGPGPFLPLIGALLLGALVVYAMTAVDARRAAERQKPLLTGRMLLYGSAGVMLLTIVVLFLSAVRAARG